MAASVILNSLILIIILKQTRSCHLPAQKMSLPPPCRQKIIHAPWAWAAGFSFLWPRPTSAHLDGTTMLDPYWSINIPSSFPVGALSSPGTAFSSLCAENPLMLQEEICASPLGKLSGHLNKKNHFLLSPSLKHLVHPGFVSLHKSLSLGQNVLEDMVFDPWVIGYGPFVHQIRNQASTLCQALF